MLEITKQRLRNSKFKVDRYIDSNILDWTNEEILEPLKISFIQAGLSENAARGLRVEKTGFKKVDVIWDYRGHENEPLHFYIEYDTRPHRIAATHKPFLKWKGKDGKWNSKKEVFHPGTHGKMLVNNGVAERKPFLVQRIIQETNDFMQVGRL